MKISCLTLGEGGGVGGKEEGLGGLGANYQTSFLTLYR